MCVFCEVLVCVYVPLSLSIDCLYSAHMRRRDPRDSLSNHGHHHFVGITYRSSWPSKKKKKESNNGPTTRARICIGKPLEKKKEKGGQDDGEEVPPSDLYLHPRRKAWPGRRSTRIYFQPLPSIMMMTMISSDDELLLPFFICPLIGSYVEEYSTARRRSICFWGGDERRPYTKYRRR